MNGFFDQPDKPVVAWRKYASTIDLSQQFQRDLLVLLPYMHDDYETFGGINFAEIERYYLKAIQDECRELTEGLLKISIYKLARKEGLGDTLIDYFGSSFHFIVSTDTKHKASQGLRLRRKGQGRSKASSKRKRWALLAMHIYILYLLAKGDSNTKKEKNAEADFLREVEREKNRLGQLKTQTPEENAQAVELEFLFKNKNLLGMAKKQWNFAKLMWDSINSTASNGPDGPPNSYEIIRRVLTPGIELTPKGILQS